MSEIRTGDVVAFRSPDFGNVLLSCDRDFIRSFNNVGVVIKVHISGDDADYCDTCQAYKNGIHPADKQKQCLSAPNFPFDVMFGDRIIHLADSEITKL
jgi:hypothetical protein